MPEGRKRLIGATKGLLESKQDKPRLYPAALGAYVDGVKQIKVGSRPDFVWCRLRGSTSEVIQAFNDSVGLHWDLPILVYRDPLAPGMWKVYGRDIRQYADWEGASYLPPHGDAHSFSGGAGTGIDPVWVFKRQYMPLLPRPVTSGTLGIYIEADFWTYGGRYFWWPGSGTTSLAPYLPTGALNGAFVTVYMDGASKIPRFIKGTEFAAWYPPSDPTDFISLPTPTQGIPLAAVFLTTGTSWIGWGEIYDLRQPAEPLFDEQSTGSLVIRDEGTLLGSAIGLNFVGPGVSASMSGSYCQVSIPGPGVDQIGFYAWDQGIPLGTGTILEAGRGLVATISGSVVRLDVRNAAGEEFFFHTGSYGSFRLMDHDHTAGAATDISSAIGTTGTTVASWVTATGTPSLDFINEGIYHVHVHARQTAGTKTAKLVWQLFRYTAGGAEIPLLTSEVSETVAVSDTPYDIESWGEDTDIDPSDRLLLKILGKQFGAGTNPTVALTVDGSSFSRLEIPATTSSVIVVTGTIAVQDEGVGLGDATTLNFVGAGVTASKSGNTATITIPGGGTADPPVTGSFVGMDEDAVLGSALAINFLGAGVTAVMDGDIFDVTIPGGADPPITGSFVGMDEDAVLGSALAINFLGDGVTAVMDGDILDVTIPGGGVGPAGPPGTFGIMGWDAGIPLGTGTILNVTGDGASLNLSGTVLELNVPGTFLQDEGGPLGYLAAIDFVGAGVTAALVGTQATVTIPGGGGNPPITGTVVILDEAVIQGSAFDLNFAGAGVTATVLGGVATIVIPGGGGSPPVTGSVVVLDEGLIQGSVTELNFAGPGVVANVVGPQATITVSASGAGATPRAGACVQYASNDYLVPDGPYITGSLMVFTNGVAQRPGTDYIEWIPESGVFRYTSSPPTGAAHVATWGKA